MRPLAMLQSLFSGRFRRGKLLLHLAFWLVYSSMFFYVISSGRRIEEYGWVPVLQDLLFHIVMMVSMGYINYFVLMPRLIKSRNVLKYVGEFLGVFFVFSLLLIFGKQYIIDGFAHKYSWVYSLRFYFNVIISAFFLVMFVGLLRFVEDFFVLAEHKHKLENEKLSSELRFLKAQINPHFLFNTLNNLYYLAETQAPNTSEVVARLSQMMRYMLHDCNHSFVSLKKEMEYMENYISLEKLRLNDEIPINYKVSGDIANTKIAPLILITFLENAFKHGVSNTRKGSWIDINLDVHDGMLIFDIKNSLVNEINKTVNEKSGIGLANVKRRLDLAYPDAYELEISDHEDVHSVHLKIKL